VHSSTKGQCLPNYFPKLQGIKSTFDRWVSDGSGCLFDFGIVWR
jgi:hypothetical protein